MYTVGVDLGGSKLALGLVDARGAISAVRSNPTDCSRGAQGIAEQIAKGIVRLCEEVDVPLTALCGVGVATPGWVDSQTGVVLSSANLPFSQFPLAERVSESVGTPVRIENDANCAALGELVYGAARGIRDVLLLTVGTGLGAGVIRGGKLMTGPGVAELGHTVLQMGGVLCGCGRRGCCEAYTSAAALSRMANAQALARGRPDDCFPDAKSVFAAAEKGNVAAMQALGEYLSCFAEMLMNAVNLFRPQLVLIGGGISQAGEAFFTPLRERLGNIARANVYGVGMPDILPAQNKNNAGILGAAALFPAFDRMGGEDE